MQVSVISRKPKGGKLVRGIVNEEGLLAMLETMPNLKPVLVDLASMSLQEQMRLVTHTDLLIGECSWQCWPTHGIRSWLMAHGRDQCLIVHWCLLIIEMTKQSALTKSRTRSQQTAVQ